MSNPDTKIKSFQLSEGKTSVFQIGLILMVALFFIGLVWLGGWLVNDQIWQAGKEFFTGNENAVNLSFLLKKEDKKLEMPVGFPEDIPIFKPGNISQAYIRDLATKDITIILDSKGTAKENFDYYLDYGKKNDWQVDEARGPKNGNNGNNGKLLLRKDKLTLSFSFEDKGNDGSEVNISSTLFDLTVDKLTNLFLNQSKPEEEKIPAKVGQTPKGFPEDFPLNGKTEITEAYTLKTENQAGATYVVKFKSDQTKSANVKFYQDWFKENNWLLSKQKPEDEQTLVSASLPFRKAVEVEVADLQLSDAKSKVEVRWRGF